MGFLLHNVEVMSTKLRILFWCHLPWCTGYGLEDLCEWVSLVVTASTRIREIPSSSNTWVWGVSLLLIVKRKILKHYRVWLFIDPRPNYQAINLVWFGLVFVVHRPPNLCSNHPPLMGNERCKPNCVKRACTWKKKSKMKISSLQNKGFRFCLFSPSKILMAKIQTLKVN